MAVDSDIKRLNEHVNTLERDMAQVGTLVERLDITIEKLTEVSTTVSQLLAVQGNRLEFQEKIQEKLQDLVEQRRQETDSNIKNVYKRIEKVETACYDDINSTSDRFIKHIDDIQTKNTNQLNEINKSINDRINKLEKWMWSALGGGIVLIWFLNQIDISKIF